MSAPVDPVELAVFQSRVHSIAEEMGAALRRTAVFPISGSGAITPARFLTARAA